MFKTAMWKRPVSGRTVINRPTVRALLSAAAIIAFGGSAMAADLAVTRLHSRAIVRETVVVDICHLDRCTPRGCRVVNVCRCPDRYSCRGLYDAYGPYGGQAYLGGYTRLY